MTQAIEFGFPREEATLALYISGNDFEAAVEILVECECDMSKLGALA